MKNNKMFFPRVYIAAMLAYLGVFAPIGESSVKASQLPEGTSAPQAEKCEGGVSLGPTSYADGNGGLVSLIHLGPDTVYYRKTKIAGRTLIKTWGRRARGGAMVYSEPGNIEPPGDFENGKLVFPTPPGEWSSAQVQNDYSFQSTRYIPLDDPENYSGMSGVGDDWEEATIVNNGLCYEYRPEYKPGIEPLGESIDWYISKPLANKFGEGQPSFRERGR